MSDLFEAASRTDAAYTAKDIEVLEGLEPVRQRPGMYIGGTDSRAMHHLAAEVLDNAMDEAVAGHASRIEVELREDGSLTVTDNGRGIPVDKHPKYKDKSALEVIFTTLHSGGKFRQGAYATSGGLHGVGISVVNALSEFLDVEVARDRKLWRQSFARGAPVTKLKDMGTTQNRRGTSVTFRPDPEIFGEGAAFSARRLYRMARSKAYLFRGVEIRWRVHESLLPKDEADGDADAKKKDKKSKALPVPAEATLHFPGGLPEYLKESLNGRRLVLEEPFSGRAAFPDEKGSVEWAIAWSQFGDGASSSYCNTVPTPQGGTHENGFRAALMKGLRAFGDMANVKKAAQVTADDLFGQASFMMSVFIRDPQFQGQTKDKLSTAEAHRLVENAVKDRFDHWLTSAPDRAQTLLRAVIERAEERLRRKEEREIARKSAVKGRSLRLPGKLADCAQKDSEGTELFIVEGDSAGGSAKQARDRRTQAVLPIRGKILNVASAARSKIGQNQEISHLTQALGCGTRDRFDLSKLRYERIIIMTDADVDGAHIATLLMTFFIREMPGLVEAGRLYLAQPPLYRIAHKGTVEYARDEAHREELMSTVFKNKGKVEVSRFKGLGEMPPRQLKETTMDPEGRMLLKISLPEDYAGKNALEDLIEDLMGKRPDRRFAFIQQNAEAFNVELDV